jgi:CBS domain-containing protein
VGLAHGTCDEPVPEQRQAPTTNLTRQSDIKGNGESDMASNRVSAVIERDTLTRVAPGDTVRTAVGAMADHVCGSVLVMAGERLLGIFTERDLLIRVAAAGRDLDRTTVGEVMTRDPDTIGADEPVAEAIRRMDEFSYRYLPVLDGDKVIGVISARHLPYRDVVAMADELEQRHALAERML